MQSEKKKRDKMNIECAGKGKTNSDKERKKEKGFTLVTKIVKKAHTVIFWPYKSSQVKKNKLRKNYFDIFMCA